jgi:hypothetical protein
MWKCDPSAGRYARIRTMADEAREDEAGEGIAVRHGEARFLPQDPARRHGWSSCSLDAAKPQWELFKDLLCRFIKLEVAPTHGLQAAAHGAIDVRLGQRRAAVVADPQPATE